MAQTHLQMQTRILREITRSSSNTDALAAVKDALVSAIRFYQGRSFWFLETSGTITVSDTNRAGTLPTDFQSLICLRHNYNSRDYGQGYGFDEVSFNEMQTRWAQNPTANSRFSKWALFGGSVYTDTLANGDQTLKIDYIKGDSSMPSADGDSSVMYEEAQDMIRCRALQMLYRDFLHDSNKATEYDNTCTNIYEPQLTSRSGMRNQYVRMK